MSDEKKDGADAGDGKKDDKKAADAKPAGGGIKALLGPIAAVVVLLGAGIGLGMFLANAFSKPPATEAGAEAAGAHGGTDGHGEAAGGAEGHGDGASHGLLHGATEIILENVLANVKDQGGKRFVKVEPSIYIVSTAGASLGLEGGGHGGGEVGGPIKRILKARIEEHLKQYDMDELTSQAIYKRLEKNIRDIAEKEMKAFAPDLPANTPVVVKVVLVGLAVQ